MFTVKPDSLSDKKIAEFKHDNYYLPITTYKEEKSGKEFLSACIQPVGVELVAQYYREKYSTDIAVFDEMEKLAACLKSINIPDNTRKAFILIVGDDQPHAIPVICVNENQKKVLIWADSLGMSEADAKMLAVNLDMPVYYVAEARQADRISCYVDALAFARDTTARDEKLKKYRFPDLLTKIKARATKIADAEVYTVKLPDELLKTAQIPEFVTAHTERSERKIHKAETLTLFRKRYADEGGFLIASKKGEVKKLNPPNYLRKKGLKLTTIIEIQFYMNELQKYFGNGWTADKRKQFIADAKKAFSTDQNRYAFVKDFLLKLELQRSQQFKVR